MNPPPPNEITLKIDRRRLESALRFLARADLKGHETREFAAVVIEFEKALHPAPTPDLR